MTVTGSATGPVAVARAPWRAVAVPAEHGGWGLTLEPVLLGLLVTPSLAGVAIGLAAFLAFLVRTPLKLALVDRHRDRWLERSGLAARIAAVELALLAALAVGAWVGAGAAIVVPVAVALPFAAVELWFDARSRGRRLVPELCGAVAVAAASAAIVTAGGGNARLAAGVWLVLAGRAVAAMPFVRAQIFRLRRGGAPTRPVRLGHLAGVALAGVAFGLDTRLLAGFVGVAAIAELQTWWHHRPPVAAKVVGFRQLALGLALVAVTAAGTWFA